MSKRPKHLRRLWKRSSTFTKVLTAFVTLAMVLEMFPAQSVAYARQVVFEAVGVDPAVLVQPVEPEEEAPAAAETPAPTEEVVVEETEPAEAVEAEDEVVVPEDQTEPAAETEDQGEAVVEETEVAPAPEEETKANEAEAEKQPEAEVKPEEPKAEEPKAEDKKDEAAKPEYPAQTLQTRLGNTIITVTADPGSLPAGSKVVASWYDTGAVQEAVEAAAAAEGKTVDDMVAIDVTILDANGNEVQPNSPVQVKFLNAGVQGDDISVYHIEHESGEATPVATDVANSVTQRFVADGFSVYVVVNTGEDARLVVNFVQADGNTATMMINKRQAESHIDQYIFDPGSGAVPEGAIFMGWTTEKNYDENTDAMTIADVRDAVKAKVAENVTDGTEVTYYAMVFIPYTVTYLDERSIMVKIDQKLMPVASTETPDYEVSQNYTPYPPEEDGVAATFVGWQQIQPEVEGQKIVYQPGDSFKLEETAYVLTATVEQGHWLSFDENLTNATYTEPIFVPTGSNPTKPTNPTRTGYVFDGWYTADASADQRDGQVSGDEFNFNAPLTANTTVYAKWSKATEASYKVVVWLQDVAGTGYDYSGTTITVNNATVGENTYQISQQGSGNSSYARVYTSNTQYQNLNSFTGFHLDRFDAQTEVAAEGNTIINVYYNRNEYTLTFQKQSGYNWTNVKTITRLYGQYIGDQFPIEGTDGVVYDQGERWDPQNSDTYDEVLVYIYSMPAESVTFHLDEADRPLKTINYYVETLPGESGTSAPQTIYAYTNDRATSAPSGVSFKLMDSISARYNGVTKAEDFIDFEGYTQLGADSQPSTRNGTLFYIYNDRQNGTVSFYYTRNEYTISYNDGIFEDGAHAPVEGMVAQNDILPAQTVKYEADIADFDETPTRDGFVFLGWYTNKDCAGEAYTFDTMPAHNVVLYAKWGLSEYQITLNPKDSTSDPIKYNSDSQAEQFWVNNGEKIGNVGGTRIYWDLVGWYTDEGYTHPFNFDAYVVNQQTVEKYGKMYSSSEIDPEYPLVIGELNLYAKWRSKLIGTDGIVVEYNANGGSGAPTDERKYVDLAEAVAGSATTSPDGNEDTVFSHWAVQKWNGTAYEDSGVNVYPGDTFEVLAANAKITDKDNKPVAASDLKDGEEYTYTVQLKAVYIEKDKELTTYINWYDNLGNLLHKSDGLKINEAVEIPEAPTRAGYDFKGWIRGVEETDASTTTATGITTLTDLFITWDGSKYSAEKVAPDENLVNDNAQVGTGEAYKYHHAMFAKWEAVDVKYTVEYYYMGDDGVYPTAPTSKDETRVAKTDTTVSVTDADKTPTTTPKFALDETKAEAWSGTVAGDGSLVLKVYFKLNQSDVTVHHYLKDTTTKVADDVTESAIIGSDYTAKAATTFYDAYAGKTLTNDPIQPVTVKVDGTEVTVYYTLPLKITAKTDSKPYDGKPLAGEYTVEGALADDEAGIKTALGDAPSITNVGEKEYLTEADQAKITGIPGYYAVTYAPGKLTITQNATAVTITSPDESKKYDGTELHKAEYTVKYGDTTVAANADGTFTLPTGDKLTITDTSKVKDVKDTAANNNTFSYVLANSDQYSNVSATYGTLTITKRAVTLTSADGNKKYDGTPLVKNAQTDVTVTGDGFVEGEGATYTITGTQTEVGDSKNSFTYTLTGGATEGDNGNYDITKVEGTLSVTKTDKVVTISSADETWKYDGAEHSKPVYTVKYGDETATADETGLVFTLSTGDTVTISKPASVKNVSDTKANNNTYEYVLTNAGQYETVTATYGTLTVTPRTVTLTSADGNKEYDGTPLVKNAQTDVTVGGDKFVEGEGAVYTITGTQTEVGESKNAFTYKLNEGTLEENYSITTSEGTLKVTELTDKVTVTITEHKGSEKYDGTEKTVTGYDVDIDNDLYTEKDFTFSGNATVKGTDAGSYPMELNASDFTNNNKNFANVEFVIVDGTLEIAKRTVTLTSGSDSKIYDGTALTKPEVTVSGDGFVAGEVTDIKAIGTITEVGKITNTITYTEGAAFKADNYNITKTEGELEITAVTEKVTVTITENSGTEKYDGTEKTVTGYGVTSISNPLYKVADFTFTGNDTVKGTNAGKYAMELKSDDFTNTNKNFANVEFVIIDGELTIEPRKVTLTSATDEKQYDGNPLTNDEVTVSEDGFVKGEGATYDVTGTQTLVGSSENTFTYTLDEGTNAKNYTITTVNGTLTVINRDAKFEVTVKANSETATYDGKDHSAKGFETLTFDVEGNTYTVSGLTTEDPSKVDAGEYTNNITGTAVVKDAKGNDVTKQFAVHTENGKLVINKLEVVIKSGTAEKQYDGKALTNDEITYPKPFVEGEGAIITMTGTQTLVGTSDNSFEYKLRDNTKADNYTISTEFGTLTVTDRETPLEITVVSKSDEVTYDGAEHTVSGFETLEFTIDGVKFTVDGLSAEGKGTDAGEYPNTITGTAVVKDADGNDVTAQFEVKQTEGKLVINPVSTEVVVTITEHSGEFVFDNTEKNVEGYDVTKISNNLYTDKDFSFSGDATVKGTEAGTYDMELKPADFANISKNFTNVKFEIVDGQLVITPKSIDDPDDPGKPNPDLTVEGPEDTVYNGLEQKQPVKVTDSKTSETLVEGEDFTLTYGDDMTNVGEVPVKVTGINNYKGEFDLSYKITPASLKVTTSSAQKVYDATPLTSAEYEIEGLVNGETLDVKTTGSQTLVGESLNTAEITWADKNQVVTESINANLINLFAAANPTAKSTNYTLSVELGTLTVTDDGVPTDLVVKKTHEGTEFGLGETVTFTLTATNIYDEARDITFVEIEGVEVEQATFQKVPAGETVTTKATYVVTEADILAGEFKNEVTAKIGDAEHGPADDTVVIEKKNPHLTVTKTVVTAEPAAGFKKGDKIEYKIVVLNDGNVTISDIKVTDELTGDEWAVESLEPGKSAEFSASYTVTDADVTAGSVTNTATATGKDPDGDEPTVTPGTAKSNIAKPVKVKKRLPKTSDPTSIMAIEALATAGLASIASGLALLRRKQKRDDEE